MTNTTCIQNLRDGLKSRHNSPMPEGCYKLREVIADLSDIPSELDRVKAVRTRTSSPDTLRHCTAEDSHVWVKSIPSYVAHSLGRNVLPGLMASINEGAPPDLVCKAYIDLTLRCEALAHSMDSAMQVTGSQTIRSIQLLKTLMEEAIQIAQQALAVADPSGQWVEITTGAS